MAKLASGKKSVAISDRSGFKIKYTDLKTTWDGLRVEPSEWEPKHPQLTPAKNVVDATALFQPRPDNDPENVDIYFGYSQNIFASKVERSQTGVGIKGQSAIGYLGLKIDATKSVSGEAANGNIGAITLFITLDVNATGVNGTGATGTEALELEKNPSGEAGTGAIGTSVPESEITASGVAGTGAFNEQGGLTLTAQNGAQLSTTQQKFGTSSLFLDGVNDSVVSNETYNFGSNVFTVDMWVRPTSGTQDKIFYDSRDSTSNNAIALRQAGDNLLVLRGNGTLFNINNVFSADTWVHIAIARGDPFGNTFSVYVNGTKEDSTTFGVTATAADIHIGSDFNGANNWAGYIDELRISDIDRYTGTSFVTPSTAYSSDGNTIVLLHFDGTNGSTSIVNSVGTSVFEIDTLPSGLAGTGAVGFTNETGNGNVQLQVTGLSGLGATGNIGEEVGVSEAIETGLAGTGAIGTFTISINEGWGEGAWSEGAWGE